MIETRRYKVLEHLLPALVTGDATSFEEGDGDDQLLDQVEDELEIGLDNGRWSISAEVLDVDEFAQPSIGPRGKVATVIIQREIRFPTQMWVGYYDSNGEYVCGDLDGRVCATEKDAERYVTERQRAETGARRSEMAGDLYDGLRECLTALKDGLIGDPWTDEDVAGLIDEHRVVEKAYREVMTSFSWVFSTDGG